MNGVRFVLEDDSWGLVRASSNKPQLVTVAEACGSEDQLYEIMDQIRTRLAATGRTGEYDQEMPEALVEFPNNPLAPRRLKGRFSSRHFFRAAN